MFLFSINTSFLFLCSQTLITKYFVSSGSKGKVIPTITSVEGPIRIPIQRSVAEQDSDQDEDFSPATKRQKKCVSSSSSSSSSEEDD